MPYRSLTDLSFVMEVKAGDYVVPEIDSTMLRTIDFYTVDISYNTVRLCKRVPIFNSETIANIRERIAKLFPKCTVEETQIRMVMDFVIDDCGDLVLIDDDSQTFHQVMGKNFQTPKFYIDCGRPDDLKVDRSQS